MKIKRRKILSSSRDEEKWRQAAARNFEAGNLNAAVSSLQKALACSPGSADLHNNLGSLYQMQKKPDKAAACYHKAVAIAPDFSAAYYNLGAVCLELGNNAEAEEYFRTAVRIDPGNADALCNLGTILRRQYQRSGDQEKLGEAQALFRRAIAADPRHGEAHYNLGFAYEEQNSFQRAWACYQKAAGFNPRLPQAHVGLGNVHSCMGNFQQAVASYRQALILQPDNVEAYHGLGNIHYAKNDFKMAGSYFQKAIDLDPDFVWALACLGAVYSRLSQWADASACYEKAHRLLPELKSLQLDYLTHTVWARRNQCLWDGLAAIDAELDTLMAESHSSRDAVVDWPMVSVVRHPDPAKNFANARLAAELIQQETLPAYVETSYEDRRSRPREARLTIGYVSSDFREHAVVHQIIGLFSLHDRKRFAVNCYATRGAKEHCPYRERIRQECDAFVDIAGLDYPDAVERIRQDKVDVLIDLNGHTVGGSQHIFALRPAPVQVTWLGYPGTTGADFIDYIVADRFVIPPEDAGFFSEKVAWLPDTYMITDNRQAVAERVWQREEAGLPADAFVFCSFNSYYKIDQDLFDRWMRILLQVPDSVLWLSGRDAVAVANLVREAEKRGVSGNRLFFAGRLDSKPDHLARLRLADLVLDPMVYNGHVSTCDALWAGVPVLTCPGRHFASRVAAGLLHAAGLSELVAANPDEYERLAMQYAADRGALSAVREALGRNRLNTPLFDTERFVRHLEAAFLRMWETFRAGEAPASFSL